MRVRWDLHTNRICPVSVGTGLWQLEQLDLKGLCDVMFVNSSIILQWVQLLNPMCSFLMTRQTPSSCLSPSCSSIHGRLICFFILKLFFFFLPFQTQAKGVMHLFVSIKLKLKHKRRELRDQIAALGRTTESFCRHTTQMSQSLSSVPVCNWRLWISYSTYFTYPFPAFFLPLKASLGCSLCSYRVSHLFIICSLGDIQ